VARPDDRAFVRLPTLASAQAELETCTFCPKLCRTVCPVSNAEPRESLTPWGKMSSVYHLARGDVSQGEREGESGFAEVAFACTNCGACANACDHQNPVGPTLNLARDAARKAGLAPEGATRVLAGFAAHAADSELRARSLDPREPGTNRSRTALVVGCAYLRGAEPEALAALQVARALVGEDVVLVGGCCGLPLLHAGDDEGFTSNLRAFAERLAPYSDVLVVDAGCARALRAIAPLRGVPTPPIELLVERAATSLHALAPLPDVGPARFHDPCQLGRGLGVYEAPRAVLTRLTGSAPQEFDRRRDGAACSGAGGLLPITFPEVARAATRDRLAEHTRGGGGTLVTACASSLRAFRAAGEPAVDLVSLLARAVASGTTLATAAPGDEADGPDEPKPRQA